MLILPLFCDTHVYVYMYTLDVDTTWSRYTAVDTSIVCNANSARTDLHPFPFDFFSDFSHERVNPFQFCTHRLSLLPIERSISINQVNRFIAHLFLQDILEALSGLVSCLRGSDEHERQDFLPPGTRVSSTFCCGRIDRLN